MPTPFYYLYSKNREVKTVEPAWKEIAPEPPFFQYNTEGRGERAFRITFDDGSFIFSDDDPTKLG